MPVLAMENEMYSKPKDDCAVSVCHIYESLEEISRGNLCNILGEPGLPPKAPTPLLKRPEKRYQNSLFSISKRAKKSLILFFNWRFLRVKKYASGNTAHSPFFIPENRWPRLKTAP